MADDSSGDKRHPPTRRKLRQAREKQGEVVRSADATSTFSFVGVLVALWLLGPWIFGWLGSLWQHASALIAQGRNGVDDASLTAFIQFAVIVALSAMVPLVLAAAVFGATGAFVQVGGLAVWSRIKPDAKHVNPAEGLKRLWSSRNLINLVKTFIKAVVLLLLMFAVMRSFLDTATKIGYAEPAGVLSVGAHVVFVACGWAAVVYVVMAALDYAHEHYEYIKRNRMSDKELRDDHKETEGDPLNANRRKSVHQELIYAGTEERVRVSHAVVYSSTVAVALQYQGERDLPRVMARGEGEVAAQIRRIARDALVPTAFDAGLAHRLYDEVPLDRAINEAQFDVVATLMRWARGKR